MVPSLAIRQDASYIVAARAVNSSEAASLHGKKALTPILAGSICGGLMILAWVIGFAIYFRKRYNRKKRNRLVAEGKAAPREKDLQPLQQKVVIPPDPAVLLGQRKPGEMVFPERQNSKDGHHGRTPWSRHASHVKPKHEDSSVIHEKSEDPHRSGHEGQPSSVSDKKDDHFIADEMTVPSNI